MATPTKKTKQPTPPPASVTMPGEVAPDTQASFSLASADDPRTPHVLLALQDYMARHGLTTNMADRMLLAKRIGTNETYIARYLSNKVNFPLPSFEDKIQGFLSAELVTDAGNQELVGEAFIVQSVFAFLRQVKAHGHIGVGHGPAGKGKTCAARLYAGQHDRTSIYLHVNIWDANRHLLVKRLAKAAAVKGPNAKLDEVLVTRLAGSDRLIILDNAHRLTEPARRWIVDFWEATRTPIALIGNPEIEKQFRQNDQHGSRVGLHRDITASLAETAEETARHMLRLHCPDALTEKAVINAAVEVLSGFGSCRALEMRAKLAAKMLKGGKITNPSEAFTLAATQLITAA